MERKRYGKLVALIMAALLLVASFTGTAFATEPTEPSVNDIIAQNAQDLYNDVEPYGTKYQLKTEISITANSDNVVEAGNSLKYTISYKFHEADSWQNGNEEWIKYFNEYTDNVITLKLPKGLLLNTNEMVSSNYTVDMDPADPSNTNPDMEHTYTFHINTLNEEPQPIEAGSESEGFIRIQLFVCNNGTADSIHEYEFDDDMVTLSTTMQIRAEDGGLLLDENGEPVQYTHPKTATTQDLQTISPDKWIVEKEGVETKLDGTGTTDDPYTVTFTYEVGVGLTEVTNGEQPGTAIDPLTNRYERMGRTLLQTMKFKDDFTTSLNTAGVADTYFDSMTIEREADTGSGWTAPVSIDEGEEFLIWNGLDEDGNPVLTGLKDSSLVMKSAKVIDTNNSGQTKEQRTPQYTKYRIKVKYNVDPSWISQFPSTVENVLKQNNIAYTTATLAGVNGVQDSHDDADLERILPIHGAGTLSFNKIFTDFNNHPSSYTGNYGPIQYELYIEPKMDVPTFSVYKADGTYATDVNGAEMNGAASYFVDVDTTYYLTPGITYYLKENLKEE